MNHGEAIESHASDRYALGMLSAAETDAFEEHYFDCADCADDVRAGMSLLEGGRRLVAERAAPAVALDSHPRRRRFKVWVPAAAAALLLLVNGGFWLRTQRPASAVVADAAFLQPGEVRSGAAGAATLVLADGEVGQLEADLPPGYQRVEAQILRERERIITAAVPTREDLVRITLPDPDPGSYELVLSGDDANGSGVDIARYRFTVQRPAATK